MFDRIFEIKNEAKKNLDEQFDLLNQAEALIKDKNMHPLEKLGRMIQIERRAKELKRRMELLNDEATSLEGLFKAAIMN